MRFFIVFLISFLILASFFYFYPANIFQAKIQSPVFEITTEVSLKAILFKTNLPEAIVPEVVTSVKPTTVGILMLFICTIGLPILIAMRFSKKKKQE